MFCTGCLAATSNATAESQSASLGNVTAVVSYDVDSVGASANARETIVRNGTTLLDQPAGTSSTCPDCPPQIVRLIPPVMVVQLDATADPEVLFTFFTGGAHCCLYSQIFRFAGPGYAGITHEWFDPGFRLEDLTGDGVPEFMSGDARFAYVFGSFASTQFPPQIWRYENGELIDVTRSFPAVVVADARSLRRRYRRGHKSPNFQRFDLRQVLLTYSADECLLGKCSTGFRLARHSVKAEEIQRGGRYLHNLRRFLRQTGYA
jgi:hypothetical protein